MTNIKPLQSLLQSRFETAEILKQLNNATRALAELKGAAPLIPREGILINTLGLREAKDSSAIENIVTTHDDLFKEGILPLEAIDPATKEVSRYVEALRVGHRAVSETGLLTINQIIEMQSELVLNNAGLRKLPGTELKDANGKTVYTPPQNALDIIKLMQDLEQFINDDALFQADPLIKMALIHHQFESIHPFYDGNGRTGRILNVLYLVKQGLLGVPVLYLSRHIVATKADYYRLLQAVRDDDAWEEWTIYMLTAIEQTARHAIEVIRAIHSLMLDAKHRIRQNYKFYSQDLINNLFTHPYTKIEFIQNELRVSRLTATRYLTQLSEGGFLEMHRIGRTNYYINRPLIDLLAGELGEKSKS